MEKSAARLRSEEAWANTYHTNTEEETEAAYKNAWGASRDVAKEELAALLREGADEADLQQARLRLHFAEERAKDGGRIRLYRGR